MENQVRPTNLATTSAAVLQQDPDAAIRVRGLTKTYGTVEAVRSIDLDVAKGEIFGLIGPDGAGKTSAFQILGGVMPATAGTAEMFGMPARDARSFVGYLTQSFSLYPDLSVAENIRYIGELRRVSLSDIHERSLRYLTMFGMERFMDRLAGKLSGGMKQKLALACALIAQPRILLLDEPTTGVDPISRREFWDTLGELSSQGMTMLVSTPYLDEAERCHRVGLMYDGKIQRLGTPTELRHQDHLTRIEVRAGDLRRLEDVLDSDKELRDVQRFGDRLDVMVADEASGEAAIRRTVEKAGLRLRDLRFGEPTLENAFVSTLREMGQEMSNPEFPSRRRETLDRGTVAIGARNLNKNFGAFHAVKGVNLEVRYGQIYGLLGANGAGKTTTIKMLCGLLEPSLGEVELAGRTSDLRSASVRQNLGYMSQKFSLYDDLTIEENLEFYSGVYGVPREECAEKMRWVMEFSGLRGHESQLTGSLPGGWKQRVAFGSAIMHEPDVLFLDEPTSGVDPLARRAFWRMINHLADEGTAILVTTHYLEEAEQCNKLGFMVQGELVAEGTPTEVKANQRGSLVELETDDPQRAIAVLKSMMAHWKVSLFGNLIRVIVDGDSDAEIETLKRRLEEDHVLVKRASRGEFSLEDCFLKIVEQANKKTDEAAE